MRFSLIFSYILISILSLVFIVQAADAVAVVLNSRGKVSLFRAKETKAQDLRKGTVLYDGDKIRTAGASLCAIKFTDDKSLLRIKENSSCTIEAKKEKEQTNKNIIVEVGTFLASLVQPKGKFTITTPTSVASVKGTQWWTIQMQDGRTMYICLEGLVDLDNAAGKFLVKEGQTALFTGEDKTPEIRLTKADEIPSDEEGVGDLKSLEIEFKDADGKTRKMIIDYQEENQE
ncbi:MAG: hypothetical protein A2Y94_04010 [Caldithrix sp. RBG_13_44_9]|nr:MAG: hypothetical protein A2Y94_04010 [Caldithrix sp. RBG_13_44_9]